LQIFPYISKGNQNFAICWAVCYFLQLVFNIILVSAVEKTLQGFLAKDVLSVIRLVVA